MVVSISAQITDLNFRIYDAKGSAATVQQIINAIGKSDAISLGENHDDAVAHFLQLEIFKKSFDSYGKNPNVVLSMERFERDVQVIVEEYLKDLITEKTLVIISFFQSINKQ